MADNAAAPPKPSSSVKLVLLGEAAVGKVRGNRETFTASQGRFHPHIISEYAVRQDSRLTWYAEAVIIGPPLRKQ